MLILIPELHAFLKKDFRFHVGSYDWISKYIGEFLG